MIIGVFVLSFMAWNLLWWRKGREIAAAPVTRFRRPLSARRRRQWLRAQPSEAVRRWMHWQAFLDELAP